MLLNLHIMQLNLRSFHKNQSGRERINEAIASNLTLKGLENIPDLHELLQDIFSAYQFEAGVLRLREENCTHCHAKLKRKGIYSKEITLPGGITMLLKFHQYSCPKCKTSVDRRLGDWFTKGERYSSNVKADATRLYLSHLSSYDAVHDEIVKVYSIPHLSKRTVRSWLRKIGTRAETVLYSEKDFSGHFVYDEEYLKVYRGDVGKKGAKLERIDVYLLLFRDAITKRVIIMLSESLDKTTLLEYWRQFTRWTIENYLPFFTITTDGKREYNIMVEEINREFGLKLRHAYCIFHFKKNLYEVSNEFLFGAMQTKKVLPEHVQNQIKEIGIAIDMPTKEEFQNKLRVLEHQIQTFIPPLRYQIKRMRRYEKNYSLHKEYPFLRTTNTCEQWFGQTKPEKIKKGYKTKEGLLRVVKALAVKITHTKWMQDLHVPKDIEAATDLLISSLVYKR